MLKLVFYTEDNRLKVRHASPSDSFDASCIWKDKLEFIVSTSGDFTIVWTSFLPDLPQEYAEALIDLTGARFPLSSDYDELEKICPKMIFQNTTDEWVFFGGTFNPWHMGHQSCLNQLPDNKICLILPDRNPHKIYREIHQVSTILEISSKAKLKKNQFLVPTFLLKEEKNPTASWIKKMKSKFPNQKLSLLLGFDSFSQLRTWTQYENLVRNLSHLYVLSRLEEEKETTFPSQDALSKNPDLKIVFLGRHQFEHVSSTNIRNKKGP